MRPVGSLLRMPDVTRPSALSAKSRATDSKADNYLMYNFACLSGPNVFTTNVNILDKNTSLSFVKNQQYANSNIICASDLDIALFDL